VIICTLVTAPARPPLPACALARIEHGGAQGGELEFEAAGTAQRCHQLDHRQRAGAVHRGVGAGRRLGKLRLQLAELRSRGAKLLLKIGGSAVQAIQCARILRQLARHPAARLPRTAR
jgi:hypothetical protein